MPEPTKVFISYGRGDDPDFVRRLHADLVTRSRAGSARPMRFFYDKYDMPSRGRSFLLELRDFIGDPATERLLLVIGPHAAASKYVEAEWRAALDRCVAVVPLLRLGARSHRRPADLRRVDEEDYGSIPEDVRSTNVHAVDFRDRRGTLPGRSYDEALDELWRVLQEPAVLGALSADVPDLPGNFVARASYLHQLGGHLLADADRPVTLSRETRFAALVGMGGVGKSVLAAAFCRACRTRRSFADGIAWVRMGARPLLPADLMDLLPTADGLTGTRRGVGLRDLSCLIVLDDVTDPAHVARFSSALGESGRLLLTTRDASVATALNAARYDVDLLSEAESLTLLADWAGSTPAALPRTATAVLRRCGRLPLAISMIGAMMKGKPADRWQHVLADLNRANLDEIRHRFPHYEHPDLLRALEVSVDALGQPSRGRGRGRSSATQVRERYLDLAVFAGNTPLPLPTLQRYWSVDGVDSAAAVKLGDLFVDRSLARRDELGRLVLHDLQHDFLVAARRPALPALHQRFLRAHRPAGGWPAAVDDGYLVDHLAEHVRAAGLEEELHGLVSREWMEKRRATGGSLRGFADDLSIVIAALDDCPSPAALALLARASLAFGTIGSMATQATSALVGALAHCGHVDRARQLVSLMPDERHRLFALSEVGGVLLEQKGTASARQVVDEVVDAARQTTDRDVEVLAMAWAARCLSDLGAQGPSKAALDHALARLDRRADPQLRVQVLENVARAHVHAGRRGEARQTTRRLFAAIARRSGHRPDVLARAVMLAIDVGDARNAADGVARLRRHVGSDVTAGEALLVVAEHLHAAGRRAEALALATTVRRGVAGLKPIGARKGLLASVALTFARLGATAEADASQARATRLSGSEEPFDRAVMAAEFALARGRRAAAAAQARRALAAVPADRLESRLDGLAAVARLLDEAGRPDEARQVLERAVSAATVVPDPWADHDTAAALAEALVRAGRIEAGLTRIVGLSDRFGALGRAQVRLARALAETGHADRAESLARSADDLYRGGALEQIALALARQGHAGRAWAVAACIPRGETRARVRSAVLDLDGQDDRSVGDGLRAVREEAEASAAPEALGLLAERLAAHGRPGEARLLTRRAIEMATRLAHHAHVAALGDLGRASLACGDEDSTRRIDRLLRDVQDREYRSEGRLRLAHALAQAGRAGAARTIVKQERRAVERLEGRDVPRATLLARMASILRHAGDRADAVRLARRAIAAIDATGGAWNSDYDHEAAREDALGVLVWADAAPGGDTRPSAGASAGVLWDAYAEHLIGVADLATAYSRDAARGPDRVRALVPEARRQPEGAPRAYSLACVARAFGRLGAAGEARPLAIEAFHEARHSSRGSVLQVLATTADAIAALDGGDTLERVCQAVEDVERWWSTAPSAAQGRRRGVRSRS